MEFSPENVVIIAGINEWLNHLFVLYYLTALVYTKRAIYLSVGG